MIDPHFFGVDGNLVSDLIPTISYVRMYPRSTDGHLLCHQNHLLDQIPHIHSYLNKNKKKQPTLFALFARSTALLTHNSITTNTTNTTNTPYRLLALGRLGIW